MDIKEEEEMTEKAHWTEVIRAFLHYEDFVAMDIAERQNHINRLPTKYVNSLPDRLLCCQYCCLVLIVAV